MCSTELPQTLGMQQVVILQDKCSCQLRSIILPVYAPIVLRSNITYLVVQSTDEHPADLSLSASPRNNRESLQSVTTRYSATVQQLV